MEFQDYKLAHPEQIETPAFLVFLHLVEYNIRQVLDICGSPEKIIPHVKTHKSSQVLKLQMKAGIMAYKCATMAEAEMVARNGVKDIVIAYPLIHPKKLARLMGLKRRYPEADIRVIASAPQHLEIMSQAATAFKQELGVYMDMELGGGHSTGVKPGDEAASFYASIAMTPDLRPSGIHAYDGHVGGSRDPGPRKAVVQKNLEYIYDARDRAVRQGLEVPDIVAGGSWSFRFYVGEEGVRVSPGKWVYFDLSNSVMTDLKFKMAALILGQVVDSQRSEDTVTVDVGEKAVSHDPTMSRRFRILGQDSMELIAQTEEHAVLKLNGADLRVGDFFLAAPGHASTTAIRYPYAYAVGQDGDILGQYRHDARDREYPSP